MIKRLPFSTDSVRKLDELLQEGLREVEANFADASYPRDKPREIRLTVRFEPDKHDPDDISTALFKEVKRPKRYGKRVNTVLRDGKLLVEEGPEETELFPNDRKVTALRKDGGQ